MPHQTSAWRAPSHLGLKAGLAAHEHHLMSVGRSRTQARLTTMGIVGKIAEMAARGAVAKPRFARVEGVPLIGRGVSMRGLGYVSAGARFRVEDRAEILGTSTEGLRFGDHVYVGHAVSIKPSNPYGRLLGVGLTVGDRASIGPDSFIGCAGGVTIGSDVMLGPGVRVFAEAHHFASSDQTIKSQGLEFLPVVIEDDCWVASGVTVTGGVTIGRGAIVGAGSVVTKDVDAGAVVAGNPARTLRMRDD